MSMSIEVGSQLLLKEGATPTAAKGARNFGQERKSQKRKRFKAKKAESRRGERTNAIAGIIFS